MGKTTECFKASYIVIVVLATMCSPIRLSAQDATVYVSPFDLGKTLSNIYFSIDKNGFHYITTTKEKANPSNGDQFDGRVQVITFEAKEMAAILACEPTVALDLPMKIIVWEEENDIYIAYTNPVFYKRRHFIHGCDEIIQGLTRSMIRVVNDAIRTQ